MVMSKLVLFIGTLEAGGAERVASVLGNNMLSYFSSVEIITYYDRIPYYPIDNNVRIISLEGLTHSRNLIKNLFALRTIVKEEKPSAFVSFLTPFNILSAFALLGIKRRTFFAVAERTDPSKDEYHKNMFLRFLRWFSYSFLDDGLVMQTSSALNYFSKTIRKKAVVLPNPLSIKNSEIGCALLTEKEKKIVSVGRLIESKNFEMLFRSFANVHEQFPEYKLVIYGEGDYRLRLEKYINKLGLDEYILLPGKNSDIISAIKSAEIFAFPSSYEGMSNAIIEALCIGLPVVTTDVNGACDLINTGINGFIIPVGDEKEMTNALISLLTDKTKAKDISTKAIMVADLLQTDKVVMQWNDFIKEGINNKKRK